MARTKLTARKSAGGKAPRKMLSSDPKRKKPEPEDSEEEEEEKVVEKKVVKEEKPDIPKSSFCYTTLVMKGDAYVPGALVMAGSLRNTKTPHDLVCMVTPDVSSKARKQLSLVFDRVIEVPVLEFTCKPLRTDKQNELY